MRTALKTLLLTTLTLCSAKSVMAQQCVVDDRQRTVCMDKPAQRIATLSPGATELAFAAGAGSKVVAVVSYSDYPPQAKQITSVGSHTRIDMERLVSLQPDLVLAWRTGNPPEQIDLLEKMGQTVFIIEPHEFDEIATAVKRIGTLAGTEVVADDVADTFLAGIEQLRERYQNAPKVRTFYQVWDEPLMSMSGKHYISKVVALCGGVNVFADSSRMIPRLNVESVLLQNPEAIIAGGMGEENSSWLQAWRAFPEMRATAQGNLFFVPPSLIQRPTPRVLEGARILCDKLDIARARR
ncbi:cobalamin-binding protein [Marinomonas piezotolerans]|uniref:Cobalamin-binding protein n=1 Tax=Marinomonas piezotolerans TaxID=2213058 RepID=A0A370UBJ0_9GAMM|nr:cobalamin-binding protein [Marinomonas piezotolerans]RDL45167.1 cobalamin-binding protein [Marinomonas piezotolerans]